MKLTPDILSKLIKEELEVILTDDEAVEMFGEQIVEEAQLELPGMESPDLCEPEDGVDDLSSQLAQMVIDSDIAPENLNALMELIYDKVADNLENIGIEDEEGSDDYQRTTMGFMEELKRTTLKEIDRGPTGTLSMDIDEPEEDPEATIETKPVKDEYTESKRLFDLFFGKYGNDAPDAVGDDLLKKIILHLFGWGLPGYKRFYLKPMLSVIGIAQQFEKEGKAIVGNQEEFRARVETLENERAKVEFDKNIAHRRTARNVKASPAHIAKALGKWAMMGQEDRGPSGMVTKTQDLQEIATPPKVPEAPTENPQVIQQQAAAAEAAAAKGSANPGTPAAAGAEAGDQANVAALNQAAQGGGEVYTGATGSTGATVKPTMARKEDEEEPMEEWFEREVEAGLQNPKLDDDDDDDKLKEIKRFATLAGIK